MGHIGNKIGLIFSYWPMLAPKLKMTTVQLKIYFLRLKNAIFFEEKSPMELSKKRNEGLARHLKYYLSDFFPNKHYLVAVVVPLCQIVLLINLAATSFDAKKRHKILPEQEISFACEYVSPFRVIYHVFVWAPGLSNVH